MAHPFDYSIRIVKRCDLLRLSVTLGRVSRKIEGMVAAEQLYLLLIDRYQVPIGQQATFRMGYFIASDCTPDRIIYGLIICYFLLVCELGLFGGVLCSMYSLQLRRLLLSTTRSRVMQPIFCYFFFYSFLSNGLWLVFTTSHIRIIQVAVYCSLADFLFLCCIWIPIYVTLST